MKAWAPAYGGAALGTLQLIWVLLLYRMPGADRGYATLAAQATRLGQPRGGAAGERAAEAALAKRPTFVSQRALKIDNWLSPFFCFGVTGGAYLSSMMAFRMPRVRASM